MAGLTLTQARARVLSLLDDVNGRRFAASGDYTALDITIQAALSACLSDYVAEGGRAFHTEVTATTSSSGLATLTGPLMLVAGVQVVESGGAYHPVVQQMTRERRILDQAVRNLSVEVVRDYQIPATASNPLVGVTSTAAPTWQAFDQWVCAEAALLAGVTDNDKRPGLEALALRMRAAVLGRLNTSGSRPMPDSDVDGSWSAWWDRLGYVFSNHPTAPTLQLVARDSAW